MRRYVPLAHAQNRDLRRTNVENLQRNNVLVAAAILAGMGLKAVERQERVFHDYPKGTVIVKEIFPGLQRQPARRRSSTPSCASTATPTPRAAPVRLQKPAERVP